MIEDVPRWLVFAWGSPKTLPLPPNSMGELAAAFVLDNGLLCLNKGQLGLEDA